MLRRLSRVVLLAFLGSIFARPACSNEPILLPERLPNVEDVATENTLLSSTDFTSGQQRRERYRGERLIDRATDPTAWLMEYHFRDRWIVPVEPAGDEEHEFQFRPTIPFLAWDQVNKFRAEVNYDIKNPSGSGLADVRLFDIVIFEESWGRWGVGPAVQLKPNSTSDDEFSIGPAAAAVTKSMHWTVGILTESFFGDHTAESFFEPILAYKFNDRWSLSVGEMKFEYDWQEGEWDRVPLSLSLAYISTLGGQKVRWFINPVYNFRNSSGDAEWMFNFGLDLLAPDA